MRVVTFVLAFTVATASLGASGAHIMFSVLTHTNSHVYVQSGIALEALSRGHDVSFLWPSQYGRFAGAVADAAGASGATGRVLRSHFVEDSREVVEDLRGMWDEMVRQPRNSNLNDWMEFIGRSYEATFAERKAVLEASDADVVVCDFFDYVCMDVCDAMGMGSRVVISLGGSILGFGGYEAAPWLPGLFADVEPLEEYGFAARLFDAVTFPAVVVQHLIPMTAGLNEVRSRFGFAPLTSPADPFEDKLVVVPAPIGWEVPQRLPPTIIPFAPSPRLRLGADLPDSVHEDAKWLDAAAGAGVPVVCGAFGSMTRPTLAAWKAIIAGVLAAHPKVRVLLAGKPMAPATTGELEAWVGTLGPDALRVRLVSYLDLPSTLAHQAVVASISHGGMYSWFESIRAGVPLLVFPAYGDQISNLVRLAWHNAGAGALIQTIDIDIVEREARKILGNLATYQAGAARARTLLEVADNETRVMDMIDRVIVMGGSDFLAVPAIGKGGAARNMDVVVVITAAVTFLLSSLCWWGYGCASAGSAKTKTH